MRLARNVLAALLLPIMFVATIGARAQTVPPEEQRALRAQIEARFDVVPLSSGIALRPKTARGDVRLIEISDTVAINGVPVSGRELRERLGADADNVLRLSYLDAKQLRALFTSSPAEGDIKPEKEPSTEPAPDRQPSPDREPLSDRETSRGDRVRVFGDVVVREGERVSGQAVAVMGSARIDGEVGDQVVAVLGSVDLGPHAIVRGDVVIVGGRLHKSPGAQVRGAVTEVSLSDMGARVHVPGMEEWEPFMRFGGFGPVARLAGTTFRLVLLLLLACIAVAVSRRAVEGAAQRVVDNPVKTTLIGITAWVLLGPLFVITIVVLALTIIGIPLVVILMPLALVVLIAMLIVGFSGTAYAVGQWARRRFGMGAVSAFADVCLGIVIILLPLLVGRLIAFGGWALSPLVFLLVAIGLGVELIAWASGFGAVLTNAFSRWQASRAARVVS
jgi:hypothetical protein